MNRINIWVSVIALLLIGCGDDGSKSSDSEDTDTADTENDTEDPSGSTDPVCTPDSYLKCGLDGHVHWYNSCDEEGDVARMCPAGRAECVNDGDTENPSAECVCLHHWQGEDCNTCLPQFAETDNCESCAHHWQGEHCEVCPENYDPATNCQFCRNRWEGDHCTECPGNWDSGADCGRCLPGWEGDDCERCVFRVNGRLTLDEESQNGLSWDTPFSNIITAIDVAHDTMMDYLDRFPMSGALPESGVADATTPMCDVWVAGGRYQIWGAGSHEVPAAHSVQLKPHVGVYGGFAGDENRRNQRDPVTHATILDGRDPVTGHGVRHVIRGSDYSIISGFIVEGGGLIENDGGGMLNNGVSPVVEDCVFMNMRNRTVRGTAIMNEDSNAVIRGCMFLNLSDNGAVYDLRGNGRIERSWFVGRESVKVAGHSPVALMLEASKATIQDSVFVGARRDPGAPVPAGRAVALTDTTDYETDVRFINCTIVDSDTAFGSTGMGDVRVVNSIVDASESSGPLHYGAMTFTFEHSNIYGEIVPGLGNISADPLFESLPTTNATITSVLGFSASAYKTTFRDSFQTWVPGALIGQLVNFQLDAHTHRWFVILENTETTFTVWGDQGGYSSETLYRILDLRLQPESSSIDQADDTVASAWDILGNPRTGVAADLGAFETQLP